MCSALEEQVVVLQDQSRLGGREDLNRGVFHSISSVNM